jgi:RNA polymerase sigma-70 factor (ECF subfamily)
MSRTRPEIERAVTESRENAHFDEAATAVIRGYGPEILGFLHGRMTDATDADDVFAVFCEKVWKGMPKFEGRSSVRVWCYVVARNAANTHGRLVVSPRKRQVAFSEVGHVAQMVEQVRTTTAAYMRTETKSRAQALRDRLSEEDRTILILRVDRELSWDELVTVFHDGHTPEDPKREAARLRKRFQLAKERLRKLAVEDGLIEQG